MTNYIIRINISIGFKYIWEQVSYGLNRESGISRSGPATVRKSAAQLCHWAEENSAWEGAPSNDAEPGELPVLSSPLANEKDYQQSFEYEMLIPASDG